MGRNTLRIVCNSYNKQISYYFKNELDVWQAVSSDSPLSRKDYTNTTMKDSAKKIILKIDEIYNRGNRGVDIRFEGTTQNFDFLKCSISDCLPDRDIVCFLKVTKIAVVGKRNVGKTSLIEGMEDIQGDKYAIQEFSDYYLYSDDSNHVEWYEIKGIEIGRGNVEKAYTTLSSLIEKELSVVIYCISASTSRMEETERDFITDLIKAYPHITVFVALIISVQKDVGTFADEIEKITERIKVIPVLPKNYEIEIWNPETGENKSVLLKRHGLDALSKYIFEGR